MSMGTPKIKIEKVKKLNVIDLEDLCDATIATMQETTGFNIGTTSIDVVEREKILTYWAGVLLVPERILFVARLDGTIAGSLQLVKPAPSNQISSFSCSIDNHFVVPWARGQGISNLLLEHVEKEAKMLGYLVIKISVRETREAAIKVFEKREYIKWGTIPKYEIDQGKIVAGFYYYKEL